jgi:hypothetical protein
MLPEIYLKMNMLVIDGKYHISTNYLQKWTRNGGPPENVCHLLTV